MEIPVSAGGGGLLDVPVAADSISQWRDTYDHGVNEFDTGTSKKSVVAAQDKVKKPSWNQTVLKWKPCKVKSRVNRLTYVPSRPAPPSLPLRSGVEFNSIGSEASFKTPQLPIRFNRKRCLQRGQVEEHGTSQWQQNEHDYFRPPSKADETGGSRESVADETGGRQESEDDETGGGHEGEADETGGSRESVADETGGRQESEDDETGGGHEGEADETGGGREGQAQLLVTPSQDGASHSQLLVTPTQVSHTCTVYFLNRWLHSLPPPFCLFFCCTGNRSRYIPVPVAVRHFFFTVFCGTVNPFHKAFT